MTSQQLAMIAKTIVSDLDIRAGTWVKAQNPDSFDARNLSAKFAGYTPDRVLEAAHSVANDMERGTPSPQDVLDRLRSQAVRSGLVDPNTCNHPRPLAIADERRDWDHEPLAPLKRDHPIGTRVGVCLRCATEIVFPPGKLLTVTEIDARKRAKSELANA